MTELSKSAELAQLGIESEEQIKNNAAVLENSEGASEEKKDLGLQEPDSVSRIKVHPSGVSYYEIKLHATDGSNTELSLRLFESKSPARLKFSDGDEETFDEYKMRKVYTAKYFKLKGKGTLVWDSKNWCSITQANALRVHGEMQSGKTGAAIGKM